MRHQISARYTMTLASALIGLLVSTAKAADVPLAQNFNFDGVLTDPTGLPITTATTVEFQVLDPSGACTLYDETQSVTPDANGNFSVLVGAGTPTANNPGLTFATIFQNYGTVRSAGANCSSGYTPVAGDGRKVRITIGATALTPDFVMGPVPMANVAQTVQGLGPSQLLQPATGTQLNQGNLQTVFSNTNYPALTALLNGTSTLYAPANTNNGVLLPTLSSAPSTPAAGDVWFNGATHNLNYFDGSAVQTLGTSGGSVTSVVAGAGLSGGAITTSGTISLPNTGTAGTYSKVTTDAFGRVTSGTNVTGSDITTGTISGTTAINTTGALTTTGTITAGSLSAGTVIGNATKIYDGTSNYLTLSVQSPLSASYNLQFPNNAGSAGMTLVNQGAGVLAWAPPGSLTSVALNMPSALFSVSAPATGTSGTLTATLSSQTQNSVFAGPITGGSAVPTFRALASNDMPAFAGDTTTIAGSTVTTTSRVNGVSYPVSPAVNTVPVVTSTNTVTYESLPVAAGGTGATTFSPNAMIVANVGGNGLSSSSGSLSGSFPQWSVGTGVGWSSVTLPTSTSMNQLLYSSAPNSVTGLSTLNNAVLVTNVSGTPSFSPLATDNFTQYALLSGRAGGQTFSGGNAAGNNLILDSTSNATKGNVILAPTGGDVAIGMSTPTAALQLKAGGTAPGSAPLKFTVGGPMATPEVGAIEFDGTNLYYTDSTSTRRTLSSSGTTALNGVTTIQNSSGNITLTPGASSGVLVSSTTASTSPATGALVVSGGLGVGGALYTSGLLTAAGISSPVAAITSLNGGSAASGNLTIDSTSNATKGNILLAPTGGAVAIGSATPTHVFEINGANAALSGTNNTMAMSNMLYSPPTSPSTQTWVSNFTNFSSTPTSGSTDLSFAGLVGSLGVASNSNPNGTIIGNLVGGMGQAQDVASSVSGEMNGLVGQVVNLGSVNSSGLATGNINGVAGQVKSFTHAVNASGLAGQVLAGGSSVATGSVNGANAGVLVTGTSSATNGYYGASFGVNVGQTTPAVSGTTPSGITGLSVNLGTTSGSSVGGNAYGIIVGAQFNGPINGSGGYTAIEIPTPTGTSVPTMRYGIYQSDSASSNYFGGSTTVAATLTANGSLMANAGVTAPGLTVGTSAGTILGTTGLSVKTGSGAAVFASTSGSTTIGGNSTAASTLIQAGTTGKIQIGSATSPSFSAMGVCNLAATAITTTAVNYSCTTGNLPASTAIAVNCTPNGSVAAVAIVCRGSGSANMVNCIASASTASVPWTCMWLAP